LGLGETNINKHLQVLNETMVNYFGRGINGKVIPTLGRNNTIQRQPCKLEEHIPSACLKFSNLRPKHAECGGGQKTKNCELKCSFCSSMGHTEDRCWKEMVKVHLLLRTF
jgi:hypothetical protein